MTCGSSMLAMIRTFPPQRSQLSMSMRTTLLSRCAQVAVSAFSLGDSAYWGGISGITVDGQAIEFDLSSASGHDWRQSSVPSAVPAPAAVWLLGSGVLGLIGFARSRKR